MRKVVVGLLAGLAFGAATAQTAWAALPGTVVRAVQGSVFQVTQAVTTLACPQTAPGTSSCAVAPAPDTQVECLTKAETMSTLTGCGVRTAAVDVFCGDRREDGYNSAWTFFGCEGTVGGATVLVGCTDEFLFGSTTLDCRAWPVAYREDDWRYNEGGYLDRQLLTVGGIQVECVDTLSGSGYHNRCTLTLPAPDGPPIVCVVDKANPTTAPSCRRAPA